MRVLLVLFLFIPLHALTITAVGDVVLGNSFDIPPQIAKELTGDYVFCNLEGVMCDNPGTPKVCTTCFRFRSPESATENLTKFFNLISIANNHVNDYGDACAHRTLQCLNQAGALAVGLKDAPDTVAGIGFLAGAATLNAYDIRDNLDSTVQRVRALSRQVDIVVVSLHIGAEGSTARHVTKKTEMFLGENRGNPYMVAHALIDAGASLVIGHGPHVTRAVEIYKKRLIIYSLGNFYANGLVNIKGHSGLAPIIHVYLKKDGSLDSARIVSIRNMCYYPLPDMLKSATSGPEIDPQGGALKDIVELCKEDKLDRHLVFEGEVLRARD